MNKEDLKQELINLGKIALDEKEFTLLQSYIKAEAYTNLRLLLSNLLEKYEIQFYFKNETYEDFQRVNSMNDMAIDLAISKADEEEYDERKKPRRRIVRST